MIPQSITWSGGRTVDLVRPLAAGLSLVVVVSAAATGFEAGWSDLLFAFAGTPLAAALSVVLGRRLFRA